MRAKLQHQDDEVKLIADELAPLDHPELIERLWAHRASSGGRNSNISGGQRIEGSPAATAVRGQPARPNANQSRQSKALQRVYVKIEEDRETLPVLNKLKGILQQHPGALQTVLFYEREQKLIGLSPQYAVRPSPELFKAVEGLLGGGAIRVK